MHPVTRENGYTATRAALGILEGEDTITREADVLAFGVVVIEVCTHALPRLVLGVGRWVVRLTSGCT